MRKYLPYILFCVLLSLGQAYPQDRTQTKITIHGEIGTFSRSYNQAEFVGEKDVTFPVLMTSTGGEFHYRGGSGDIFGCGIVQSYVSGGKKLNYDRYEYQPKFFVTLPYLFIGRDFGFWALEAGLSYYFYVQKLEERYYLRQGGDYIKKDPGGYSLDRSETHVFVNIMARIFPEDSIHFKIRYGRERFNVLDTLLNIAAVFPYGSHQFEFILSFPATDNWFDNHKGELRSNQRIEIAYAYALLSFLKIGANTGFVVNNRIGGNGETSMQDRMSGGLFLETKM
jgi:hypothetical protein